MVFTESVPPDITEALPADLGARLAQDYPPEAGWDVSFGSLGFNLKPSQQFPYQRGTEAVRKQQLDVSESAGEQSLSSWWVRSQESWDMGAGIRWYEPGADAETINRFADSVGIDPWTPGEISLLKRMDEIEEGLGEAYVCSLTVDGVPGYVRAVGTSATWVPEFGDAWTVTLPNGSATQPSSAGGVAYIGHFNGVSVLTPGEPILTPITCSGTARAWWIKSRLIVAVGTKLYEVPPTYTGTITGAGPVLLYTHPTADWEWTDVTETGGAILAAGYSHGDSAIFRFSITEDALNQPVLGLAGQVARMPIGERIYAMGVYLGTQLVLGTSMGVRVGLANETGEVQYGPLTVETAGAVLDVTFRDRFAYVAVTGEIGEDGNSGVIRIDLSARVGDSERAPYANDVHVPGSGEARSVALVGDRVVLAHDGFLHFQSADQYVTQGWLDTGRIRYRTSEPKAFRLARAVVDTRAGRVGLTSVTPAGTENRVVEYDDTYRTESDVLITIPGVTVTQFLSFRVYLTASEIGTSSPVVSGLSIKAQPAASRVRLYQFPVACYDLETTRHGRKVGTPGGAFRRLQALEYLEEESRPVQVKDFRTGETFTGMIDSNDFTGTAPPDRSAANFGGTLVVTVRRI